MATYTYTPEKGDPISRLRLLIGDRTADSAKAEWSDEELYVFWRETAMTDFLQIYFGTSGATQASVEVVTGSSFYQLELKHTVPPAAQVTTPAFAIGKGTDLAYDKIVDLITAIRAVTGWEVQLASKAEGDPLRLEASPTGGMSELDLAIAYGRRAWSLAPTGSALSVIGSANAVRLSIYDLEAAAARVRAAKREAGQEVESYSEGRVSMSFRDPAAAGVGGGSGRMGMPAGFMGRVL